VLLQLTLNGDLSEVGDESSQRRAAWAASLTRAVATNLAISQTRVTVVNVRSGSLLVEIRIADPTPGSATERSAADCRLRLQAELASAPEQELHLGSFSLLALSNANSGAKGGGGGGTAAIVVVVLLLLAAGVGGFLWYRRRQQQRPMRYSSWDSAGSLPPMIASVPQMTGTRGGLTAGAVISHDTEMELNSCGGSEAATQYMCAGTESSTV